MNRVQKLAAGIGAALVAGGVAVVVHRQRGAVTDAPPELVTLHELTQLTPRLTPAVRAQYLPLLNGALAKWGINTVPRIAAALGQWLHESWQFSALTEIAPNVDAYAANTRLGNTGGVADAALYIGRGVTQLTGRANYTAAGKALGLDLVGNPELAADPRHAFDIAGWFWRERTGVDLSTLADRGDFIGITRRINGGTNGQSDREYYHGKALAMLNGRKAVA